MNRLLSPVPVKGFFKRIATFGLALFFTTATTWTFLSAKTQAAACTPPSQDYGTATISTNIPSGGTYRIWSRMLAPDTTNNSYLLEVDGNTCYVVGDQALTPNTWTWVDNQNGNTSSKVEQSFTAGNHSFKLIGREPGVKVARILLASDLNCVPTSNGDNCAVAGDTEAPAVTITSPTEGATVTGTKNFAANASDNVGVSKVEFYVSGTLKATDTTAPYGFSWDSVTTANGNNVLMVKAFDAAGNTSTSSIQVTVLNGDIIAPSVPTGVTATAATSGTQVTVKWNASTDNTGVAGYWVNRDGVTLSQVTSSTQFVDNNVLPGKTYNYRVAAYDTTGNTSALSTATAVTTPVPPTPDTTPPSAPGNLRAQGVSESQINLSWDASSDNVGVANYDVFRAVGSGPAIKIATVGTTSFGDTGLAAATSYNYYVVARDGSGNVSGNSNQATARTQPKKGRKAVIHGKVTLRKGSTATTPIQVTLSARGVKKIVTTDSAGNYYIDDLPGGTYSVRYQAPRYYSKVVTVKVKTDKVKKQNITLRRR